MSTRRMIDVTHSGLPAALPAIKALPVGSLVALYDTGSPDIVATANDLKEIPSIDRVVLIDQGFTGSPNLNATVRDCENGAWSIAHAVNKTGWNVPRPTLYLGFPDTAQEAANAGWKGDVWLVHSSPSAPAVPPAVPAGLNVVAQQWHFTNAYDESVVFDSTWPAAIDPPPHQITQAEWRWCFKCESLFYGPHTTTSNCPAGGTHDGSRSGDYHLTVFVK
jgi:hypothetical protein